MAVILGARHRSAALSCGDRPCSDDGKRKPPTMRLLQLLRILPSRLAIAAAPLLRFLAALFLLGAAVLLVADMTQQGSHLSTAAQWKAISPSSLAALQSSVTRSFGAWVWDPVLTSILSLPAYVLLGTLAVAAGIAGRRRRVVNVFIN